MLGLFWAPFSCSEFACLPAPRSIAVQSLEAGGANGKPKNGVDVRPFHYGPPKTAEGSCPTFRQVLFVVCPIASSGAEAKPLVKTLFRSRIMAIMFSRFRGGTGTFRTTADLDFSKGIPSTKCTPALSMMIRPDLRGMSRTDASKPKLKNYKEGGPPPADADEHFGWEPVPCPQTFGLLLLLSIL